MAITNKVREDIECFFCEVYDVLDPTKANSEFLQSKWASMSNEQFFKWLSKPFPLQIQVKAWEIEPTFAEFTKAAKIIGIELLEKIALPYLYINKAGVPVNSKLCLITFIHLKKVQQFVTKKNKVAIDIDDRDMKSGRLGTGDKGSATSDKEFESAATMGFYNTMEEFSTIRADSMNSKSEAYNTITSTGILSKNDYTLTLEESLSRNLINVYLMAAHISTNLVNTDGYTPYTMRERSMKTQRLS